MNTVPGMTFRPIHQWPGPMTPAGQRRSRSRFQAAWPSTVQLLEHELRMLDARDIVLQLDLTEADLRRDGLPRAHARPGHPGTVLAFVAPVVGPLQFACDTYDDWQANLRAVALTLQALRAVERYGATKTGEQYRGWAQIEPPAANSQMTVEDAARYVAGQAGHPLRWRAVLHDLDGARADTYRAAARRLHPDAAGGSHEAFARLQQARRVLDSHAREPAP